MNSVVIPDRGPSPYFHGRKEILQNFTNYLKYFEDEKTGTVFLIQGAPGAGKTALLDQCEKIAQKQDWNTVEIDAPALWDPDALNEALRLRAKSVSTSVRLGKDYIGGELRIDWFRQTLKKMLQSGDRPLLLVLDEAQMLGGSNKPVGHQTSVASNILKAIHNGKLGRPVVLLAAGLGTTKSAFVDLEISRFDKKCFIQLGALSKESERAVIQDWLKEEGRAKGDPTSWIDSIANESHGWPQHISSFVDPAVEYLKSNNHQMTDEGLKIVIKKGSEFRFQYYETRVRDFSKQQRQIIASLISNLHTEEFLEEEDVMDTLIATYGPTKSEKFFNVMLNRGILHLQSGGMYDVPIPSMRDWLINNYASK